MSYKIESIEIEGFRGIVGKQQFDFNSPSVLLFGGNHQGKSSVLNAIEWCLHGDNCIGKKSGIQERVGVGSCSWRVVNDKTGSANVKLTIKSKNKNILISRTETRGEGRSGKNLKVSYKDGKEFWGDDAEVEILNIFNISHKDFSTTVYQHQENIRDFIIQTASDRSNAIDRLLGLSDYRNLRESDRGNTMVVFLPSDQARQEARETRTEMRAAGVVSIASVMCDYYQATGRAPKNMQIFHAAAQAIEKSTGLVTKMLGEPLPDISLPLAA